MAGQKKTKARTITLNTSIIKKVEERAVKENRNFSNMVETLLMQATQRSTT